MIFLEISGTQFLPEDTQYHAKMQIDQVTSSVVFPELINLLTMC